MDNKKLNRLILMALMVALSFVGANIKMPGFSTIAFDSFPAYFAGILMGGVPGGIVGFLGHMMTSFLSGFPFGLPMHLVIAVMMFVAVFVFSFVTKKTNWVIGAILAVLINGVAMPIALVLMPGFEWAMAMAFIPMLVAASGANVALAILVYKAVSRTELAHGFKNDEA